MALIIMDGKEYEISDSLARRINDDIQKDVDPFHVAFGDICHFIHSNGTVYTFIMAPTDENEKKIDAANCCRDSQLMEQRANYEKLSRLLWRYAIQHGGNGMGVTGSDYVYCITKKLSVERVLKTYVALRPSFASKRAAEGAIDDVITPFLKANPEFDWLNA